MAPCVCNVPNCPFPKKENWRVVLAHYKEAFAVHMNEWRRQVAEVAKQLEVGNISGKSTKASRKQMMEAFKAACNRPTEEGHCLPYSRFLEAMNEEGDEAMNEEGDDAMDEEGDESMGGESGDLD